MNNVNWTWFFIFMSLFNTSLGVSNINKNTLQQKKQNEIENKLDEILKRLEDK